MAPTGNATETLTAPLLALALALASCGGSDAPASADPAPESATGTPGAEAGSSDAPMEPLASAPPLIRLPEATFAEGKIQGINLRRDARKGVMLTDAGVTINVAAATDAEARPMELRFEIASAVPNDGQELGRWNPLLPGPDLLVQETGTDGAPAVESTTRSWRTVVVPLQSKGATSVQIRFEGDNDPARPTWITEPWVVDRDPLSKTSPRTVLLITSDTHRADHVSALNPDSPVATPFLDALSAEGAVFTNCYTAINNTNPSHIALMTGLHPRDIKIVNNNTRLSRDADTLAERFRAEGYRCYAALSAFHLFDQLSGLGQGFHRMNAFFKTEREGDDTLELAAGWLEDAGDAPVFLWIHLFDVHSPYRLYPDQQEELLAGRPDPYREDVDLGVRPDLVPNWLKKTGVRDASFVNAMYAGEVRYLDGQLGPFLRIPRLRDSIVAFTADHGEGLGEQSTFWTHFGVLTSTIHVPLILRGPGVDPSAKVDAPVEMIDVGKTLLRMAGANDEGFPGDDVREVIREVPPPTPRFALAAHGICASIESEGWLLQMFLKPAVNRSSGRVHRVGSIGLFRLDRDPHCKENVLLGNFERAKRMRAALARWLEAAVPMGLNGANKLTAEQEEKLKSLGYASGGEAALRWWAPEFTDLEWDTNPWRMAFEGDGNPELLEGLLEPVFDGEPRPHDGAK